MPKVKIPVPKLSKSSVKKVIGKSNRVKSAKSSFARDVSARPEDIDASMWGVKSVNARYSKGDVWDNPDGAVANKEYKAFHNPKAFLS
jgi:hypothetical protein